MQLIIRREILRATKAFIFITTVIIAAIRPAISSATDGLVKQQGGVITSHLGAVGHLYTP